MIPARGPAAMVSNSVSGTAESAGCEPRRAHVAGAEAGSALKLLEKYARTGRHGYC